MKEFEIILKKILKFREERDWKKFHTPKDMALSLVLEASEVLEHFQWKDEKQVMEYIKLNKTNIGEELADVLYWVLLMSHDLEIDVFEAVNEKMKINQAKYPVEKCKGSSLKYNQL